MTESERIELAASCPDLGYFDRVADAGLVFKQDAQRVQRTHYGGLVLADGYYGEWMTDLIHRLKGVHEPQEEMAFAEILPSLPARPRMLECGGYWAFYSLWLKMRFPLADIHIVEPIDKRRAVGERNFALNGLKANFRRAALGSEPGMVERFESGESEEKVEIVTVDQLFEQNQWQKIDVLHADIQGFEFQMLRGAKRTLAERKVDWVFISTHRWLEDGKSLDLHATCIELLQKAGYKIVVEHTPEESFTVDGLVVAKADLVGGVNSVALSRLAHD